MKSVVGSRGPSPACGRGASPSPVAYDVVSGAVPVRYVVSGVRCRAWLATVVASLPRSHVVMVELFYRAAPVAAGVSIWRRCLLAVPCQRDDFGCACFRPQLRSVPHCVQLAMASRRATTRHLGAITVPHVPLALSPHNVIIFPHCQVSI